MGLTLFIMGLITLVLYVSTVGENHPLPGSNGYVVASVAVCTGTMFLIGGIIVMLSHLIG